MNTKITKSLIAGVVATAVMTLVMFVAPMMGMPKMNPADMLSSMMGVPIVVGWIMHFIIGIVFAVAYVLFFNSLVKISNKILKGALFGIAVFIIAQIGMGLMSLVFGEMPAPEGSMVLTMVGSVLGHVVYGIVVALIVKEQKDENKISNRLS
jgi:uncharacterized membrane protein YagU involved in acid resistance